MRLKMALTGVAQQPEQVCHPNLAHMAMSDYGKFSGLSNICSSRHLGQYCQLWDDLKNFVPTKMRFLCLHGAGTNSEVFRAQLGPICAQLEGHEFVFLDGHIECGAADRSETIYGWSSLLYVTDKRVRCSNVLPRSLPLLLRLAHTIASTASTRFHLRCYRAGRAFWRGHRVLPRSGSGGFHDASAREDGFDGNPLQGRCFRRSNFTL